MAKATIKKRYDDGQLNRIFPSWYTVLYGAACGFLIPWTVLLAIILPQHYVSQHWDIAWAGFDAFECLLFALTAFLAFRHSTWTAVTASMLGTTLLIDAWFDILTARTIRDERSALLEALVVEIPIAILSFLLAHRVFNHVRRKAIN